MGRRFPNIPDRLSGLEDLAYNLWWSWHPAARMLFKMLDREAWKESIHNPVKMLRELPGRVLEAAVKDPRYLHHYDAVLARFHREISSRGGWFSENVDDPGRLPIAYFSAEYGLQHSLPFYAGGLGFLAGDHLKECSDLGVPMVAVGFMYPEGYMGQRIREDGWQQNVDEALDRDAAPVARVLDENGKQLVVKMPFVEPPVYLAVWKVSVGRIPLYLIDTDIEMNTPWNRSISSHLYIGDLEQRLRQELVLGVGGSEVLYALGIKHSVLHLNEGHPAFALLERIRERVEAKMSFEDASAAVYETSVFTTHTPVPAGHDVFPYPLIDKYFKNYYPLLGLGREDFLRLGYFPDTPAGFNMTAFALRMCRYRNGVSRRHGEVSRKMWRSLWPESEDKTPIAHVTNGVHVPTWIEPKMELLLNKYLGPEWLEDHDNPAVWELIEDIDDRELWQAHVWLKLKLASYLCFKSRERWSTGRISPSNVVAGGALLDPMALTIGFARRFTAYKRADLVFRDTGRLKRLLKNPWRPVQIIFAGKAHPEDDDGKRILQKIFNFARDPDFGGRVAFAEDYDEQLAQYMVHGVDLWLNNPLPPLEACGTSGMKASANGVPQLSILDGWWIEGYNGENGWAVKAAEGGNEDEKNADSIYELLENRIVPLYYSFDEHGVPKGWVRMMKAAMKSVGPAFSARRMVREYTEKFYRPALKMAVK